MKNWSRVAGIFLFLLLGSATASNAQFFQVKITEPGIYRFSVQQIQSLGLGDLNEVAIFGYPGMLPQKLDSAQLTLQEIPMLNTQDGLLTYLEGPHRTEYRTDGTIFYAHHLYTDTLTYFLGKKDNPKRISPKVLEEESSPIAETLYQFYSYKEEKTNLLESGKQWYSLPIRSGQSLNTNFDLSTSSSEPWILSSRLMAQSTSPATMRILTGNDLLEEVDFSPIPTTTYGIKGVEQTVNVQFLPPSNSLRQIRFTYQGGTGSGFLDFLTLGVPKGKSEWISGVYHSLSPSQIRHSEQSMVLEISDFYNPMLFSGTISYGKKWAISSSKDYLIPKIENRIDLSLRDELGRAEFLILTPKIFLSAAQKLQSHKQSMGITTQVVTLESIYPNFSYGNPDLMGIRNFLAWEFHAGKTLKNVLILGKGTFDYKGILGGRPSLIPIYTSENSLDPLKTYSSDDFFALLEWGQGEWKEDPVEEEDLQIGIGRIPAITYAEAAEAVDKIIRYESQRPSGDWKRKIGLMADDGDQNIHLRDAEKHAEYLFQTYPEFQIQKLYLDRFAQESAGQSQTSVQAKETLDEMLQDGVLLLNYIGHGNETTLTAEEIFQTSDILNWPESETLPLWMTATCEFGRHDSPFLRSAAEELLFAKKKGAIALLSTGRPVFSSVNFDLNKAFWEEFFRSNEGSYHDLGTLFKNTKNRSQRGVFNRNFSLIGDPSLRLLQAELIIEPTEIKSLNASLAADTLRPLQQIQLEAKIADPLTGAGQPNFNGTFEIEIWDKPTRQMSLGDESNPVEFTEESNLIFKGSGEVKSGILASKIILPANLNPTIGLGNIRLWAKETAGNSEAKGIIQLAIGGEPSQELQDTKGPEIQVSVENKTNGPWQISSKTALIQLDFQDQSGINSSLLPSSQLLQIQINDSPARFLGNLYVAKNGSYETGTISTRIEGLKEGKNQVTIWAWDNAGNGSVKTIDLEVKGSQQVQILSHLVFPNPASEVANFQVRHNRPGETLVITLEIFSLTAQILYSKTFRLVKAEEKIENLTWNFFQNLTKYPAKGTYIYRLSLLSEDDLTSDFIDGKLVIE